MKIKKNGYRVGGNEEWFDDVPTDLSALDDFAAKARKRIEPWLSAVFQGEHLNLLLGSGFTVAVGAVAKVSATGMDAAPLGTLHDAAIDAHALDRLLYTSPSPRDRQKSRMPSSA